jgi:hypothetical protein
MERSLSNLEVVEECVLDNSVETWFHFTLIPHTVRCCIICFEVQLDFTPLYMHGQLCSGMSVFPDSEDYT